MSRSFISSLLSFMTCEVGILVTFYYLRGFIPKVQPSKFWFCNLLGGSLLGES